MIKFYFSFASSTNLRQGEQISTHRLLRSFVFLDSPSSSLSSPELASVASESSMLSKNSHCELQLSTELTAFDFLPNCLKSTKTFPSSEPNDSAEIRSSSFIAMSTVVALLFFIRLAKFPGIGGLLWSRSAFSSGQIFDTLLLSGIPFTPKFPPGSRLVEEESRVTQRFSAKFSNCWSTWSPSCRACSLRRRVPIFLALPSSFAWRRKACEVLWEIKAFPESKFATGCCETRLLSSFSQTVLHVPAEVFAVEAHVARERSGDEFRFSSLSEELLDGFVAALFSRLSSQCPFGISILPLISSLSRETMGVFCAEGLIVFVMSAMLLSLINRTRPFWETSFKSKVSPALSCLSSSCTVDEQWRSTEFFLEDSGDALASVRAGAIWAIYHTSLHNDCRWQRDPVESIFAVAYNRKIKHKYKIKSKNHSKIQGFRSSFKGSRETFFSALSTWPPRLGGACSNLAKEHTNLDICKNAKFSSSIFHVESLSTPRKNTEE